jgi:hypothetical protein
MERRHFLKLALGFTAGATALAATARAAPISPQPLTERGQLSPTTPDIHSAVTSQAEVEHLKPEQVYWHHRHWGWRHRHWRRWHRRHWRRWHRRHWY